MMSSKVYWTLLTINLLCIEFLACQHLNLNQYFESETFDHASVALTILDAESGLSVYNRNGNLALIPASTLKTITAFSALDILGSDFRFKTKVSHTGELLSDGTLDGDLIIRGDGDPTLGSPYFKKALNLDSVLSFIYKNIHSYGINCIDGRILIDNSAFTDNPINDTWQWNDLSNYYATGVWAFNIHENLFNIYFRRFETEFSRTTIYQLEPLISDIQITNRVTTGRTGSGDHAYIYSNPMNNQLEIRGTIPPGNNLFKIKGAIPRPDLFFINTLNNYLSKKGISCSGMDRSKSELSIIDSSDICEMTSPPLSDIVKEAILKSNNLYCEALLKAIAEKKIKKGSTNSGVILVKDHLKDLNLDISGFTYKDGSGLSARNRITTNIISKFLHKQYQIHGASYLKKHLLEAGKEGSAKRIFNRENYLGQVFLKSGSIDGVIAYCGYLEVNQKKFTFSFISNAHQNGSKRTREAFVDIISNFMKSTLTN